MVHSELTRVLSDPLEAGRQWASAGERVVGCLDSYVPEEFLHAAGFLPQRLLGSLGNVTLADTLLPVFAGKLARSILDQALAGEFAYLTGVVITNSSDAVRMLYDLWTRHVPGQWVSLIDVPAILEGRTNRQVFGQAMLRFKEQVEGFAGKPVETEALRRSIGVFNENRRLLKELSGLLAAEPRRLSARDYLDAVLGGFTLPKEKHNLLLRDLVQSVRGESALQAGELVPVHISGPILVDRSFIPLLEDCGATMVSEDLGTGSRYYWDEVSETGDPTEAVIERYWSKIPESYKTPMEPRWLHLTRQIERSRARGVIFVVEKYSDEDQYDYPVWRDRLRARGIPSLLLDSELILEGEQVRTRVQTFVDILRGGAFS